MVTNEFGRISNPLSSIFTTLNGIMKDGDMILILAMIILLSQDGADKMLILALIYILS